MNVEVYINKRPVPAEWLDGQFGDVFTGVGGSVGVTGAGGSVGVINAGGSIGVSPRTGPSREVVVQVYGTFVSAAGAIIPPYGLYESLGAPQQIRQALTNKGWDIRNVAETSGQPLVRYFQVTANVLNIYTDSQVVTNMRNHLAPIMTVGGVSIIQSSPAAYINGNADNPSAGSSLALSGGSSFLSGLGVGAIGTTGLLVGGLILILFLRR
jgi:hypothetical protein